MIDLKPLTLELLLVVDVSHGDTDPKRFCQVDRCRITLLTASM